MAVKPMHRSGFTLLEVVLAMGVLALGATAILAMFTFGTSMVRTASLRQASAEVVEAIVADLEETLFPLMPDGSIGEPIEIDSRPVAGREALSYSARARPAPDQVTRPDGALEYRVDVDLQWTAEGLQRTQRFTVLLLREIPFGHRLRLEFVQGQRTEIDSDPDAKPVPSETESK